MKKKLYRLFAIYVTSLAVLMSIFSASVYAEEIAEPNVSVGEGTVETNVVEESTIIEESTGEDKEDELSESQTSNDQSQDIPQDTPQETPQEGVVPSENDDSKQVTDIDLGEYNSEMLVGTKQLLMVTLIPTDAEGNTVEFRSSNEEIATINGLGRISALAVGQTVITVKCGEKEVSFTLKVKEKESEKKTEVKDIEISSYKKKIKIDEVIVINAKILPMEASGTELKYKSSDEKVATVNSSGEVKGIGKGKVTITVSAGDISKKIELEVVVATKKISIDKDYFVLKPGDTRNINASVVPEESNQEIKYKSMDESVASVTPEGVITAKKVGNTSIIVSNEDLSVLVTVIVNQTGKRKAEGNDLSENDIDNETSYEFGKIIDAAEYSLLTKDMLKYIYENEKNYIVVGDGYSIKVEGKNIVNYNNELNTKVNFTKGKDGDVEFEINAGKNLCGEITLSIDDESLIDVAGKDLYLYNVSKKTYEKIQYRGADNILITKAGKYKFSDEKIKLEKKYVNAFFIGVGFIGILVAIYIFTKKRYLFW
jgi:hypothetical protein